MRNSEMESAKQVLTTAEAAAFLAVNPETLRRYRQRGILKAVVISKRKIMFQRAELERFLTAHVEG